MSEQNRTERLHVMLTPDEMDALEGWRKRRNAKTVSDIVRMLLKAGMIYSETAQELAERCGDAVFNKKSDLWIMQNILDGHPKISSVTFDPGAMWLTFAGDKRITINRNGKWSISEVGANAEK